MIAAALYSTDGTGSAAVRPFDHFSDWWTRHAPALARTFSKLSSSRRRRRNIPPLRVERLLLWLERVREAIDDSREWPRVGELASVAGVHRVQLARQFRRYFGCSVSAYVRRTRVQLAAERIVAGGTIAAASHDAGFHDHAHLCHAFEAETSLVSVALAELQQWCPRRQTAGDRSHCPRLESVRIDRSSQAAVSSACRGLLGHESSHPHTHNRRRERHRRNEKSAPLSPPVLVLRNPTMFGPTKPAMLPSAFTSAMPTAAELPLSRMVGSTQNGARKLITAMFANARLAKRAMGSVRSAAPAQPSATTSAHAAA